MQFYRGKFTNNEPNSFWTLTVIVIIILSFLVTIAFWFFIWGHEPFEPIHDEEPHASITTFYKDFGLKKG